MGRAVGLKAGTRLITALSLLLATLLLSAAPVSAQAPAAAPPPPMPSQIDGHGVDLTSGKLILGGADVGIGPDDHRGLRFTRQWSKNAWRIAELPAMSGSTSYPIVSFGGRSVPFEPNGSGGYKAVYEDGSTLSNDRTTFTASDGTQIIFAATSYQYYVVESSLGVGTQVIFPDGVRWNYHYETTSAFLGPEMPAECSDPYFLQMPGWPEYCGSIYSVWQTYYGRRLSSITSSTGYQIKLHYATNVLGYEAMPDWWKVTQATALNNAVEYCNPAGGSCSFANTWPQATYSNWAGKIDAVTAPGGTTNYSYTVSASYQFQLAGIRPPGASSNLVTYGYTSDKVTSVTVGPGTWNYVYGSGYTTVTDPASAATTAYYNSEGLLTSSVAGGQTTSFTYCGVSESSCPEGLLKRVTAPEGNYVQYAYDARGNRTSETRVAKSGSGLANIVTSAAYPASCANQKTCNKPTSTTDARGKVTDYTYDAGHGGLLTATLPADASGIRPQTRITYANRQAYYKNSSGSIVASGTNIALLTQIASCRTSASCTNGTDERKTTIDYGPQTAGVANNLNPVGVTTSRGDGALAATSTTTYDNYGRALTVDGPLPGTADSARVRYNLAGQVLGEVGPDPDDAGASKFLATRYSYNAWGQRYLSETGTVNGLSDADWAAFSATGNTIVEFGTYGRPVRQKLRNGTTTYQVVDQRYDALGRVQCSMVRMDDGNWGTLPNSCNPTQATGPNGPDRVTYNHYDALGRVWKVTTGYGTSVAADEQIATFSANGRVLTLTDAEGNRTTYEYDGHDRQVKTLFPSPTTDGVSSTTDYEQFGYDAAGNVTSFRTPRNETLTLTYDNLNRLVTKVVPERSGLAATHTRDVYFGYDLFGNMTYARFDSTGGQGITNAYDALGQLTSSTVNLDGTSRALSYLYDVAGNLTRITHWDGNYIEHLRRGSGALNYLRLNGSGGLAYPTFDAAGRQVTLQRYKTTTSSWGPATGFAYDGASRLNQHWFVLNTSSHNTSTTFTYNPAGQIASSTRNNDLYAWPGAATVDRSYTANGLNQYSAVAGTSFGYDLNGNLTGDGSNAYVYDVENHLVTRSGGGSATLRYDPLGRLYEVTGSGGTRRFLYDGDALVAEYNAAGTTLHRYVHGTGAGDAPLVWFEGSGVADAARRYLFADERGSIAAVTDSAGNVTNVNSYDEYGIPASTNVGAFQYTGQVWLPELGMYHYKARMYSPTLGRFMQTDPIGYGDGMNMYAYVKNDPVNFVDPTGLCMFTDTFVLTGRGWRQNGSFSDCPPPLPPGAFDDWVRDLNPGTNWQPAQENQGGGPAQSASKPALAPTSGRPQSGNIVSDASEVASNVADRLRMQLRENARKGRTAEQVVRQSLLRQGYTILAEQLWVRDQHGRLRIYDFIVAGGPNGMSAVEAKYGSASYSLYQRTVDAGIATNGGTVVNWFQGNFPYGTSVQFTTGVSRVDCWGVC